VTKMNLKPAALAILLLLSLTLTSTAGSLQAWKPGVADGDYFYYEMYGHWVSNHPNETLQIPQFEYNNTDWTRINITAVEGTIVHQTYTLHYKNGSETSFNFTCDVNPESNVGLQFNQKGVPLCAANLTIGDTMPTDQTIIDETVNRAYVSGLRETNHASWNSTVDWGDIYFDRQTGMLVELCRTHRFASNTTDEIVDKTDIIKITSTNKWQVTTTPQQPFTPLFIVLTIGIFFLLCTIVAIRRFITKKTRNRQLGSLAVNYK
jgi:hypothetical protein